LQGRVGETAPMWRRSRALRRWCPRHRSAAHTGGMAERVRPQAAVQEWELPTGGNAPNVAGRRLAGPTRGFGQLWRKRFSLALDPGIPPERVIATWKRAFSAFWPGSSELKANAIAEDEVAAAELELPAGGRVATGLIVVRSDPRSFTMMTLEGHMFAGWVRFAADEAPGGTAVSVEIEMRAGDPIYELGLMLGGHRHEERFWQDTLTAVANHFGQSPGVRTEVELVDGRRQWGRITNTWHNAAIRTQLQRALGSLRSLWGRLLP
jgi:hypothetical protein